jgi:type IV secretory pathway protease TraF
MRRRVVLGALVAVLGWVALSAVALSAAADRSNSDRAATAAYVYARHRLLSALLVSVKSESAPVTAYVQQVSGKCPGVPGAAPHGAHVVKLGGPACDAPVPVDSSINFIKRIVAGPGDEIYIREGHVYRKAAGTSEFIRESDPYIRSCGMSPECDFPDPIKIPAGDWFMMGDNRGESDDSRFWGPVPTAWIIGIAAFLECRVFHEGPTWVRRTAEEGCSARP